MNIGIILYGQQFHTLLNQLYNGPVLLYQKLFNRLSKFKIYHILYQKWFILTHCTSGFLFCVLQTICLAFNMEIQMQTMKVIEMSNDLPIHKPGFWLNPTMTNPSDYAPNYELLLITHRHFRLWPNSCLGPKMWLIIGADKFSQIRPQKWIGNSCSLNRTNR